MTRTDGWIPELETERLRLRPFAPIDAPRVQELASDARVAQTTASIPHPYPEGAAAQWIAGHPARALNRTAFTWAMERKEDGLVLGTVSLLLNAQHERGEVGYWLGAAYWNEGYTTEAVRCIIAHGFKQHGLHRIQSQAMLRNPASWRVMEKVGMTREGVLRDYFKRGEAFEDIVWYGVLCSDWQSEPTA